MEAEDPAPALAVRAGPVAAARRAVVSGIAPSVAAHPAHPVARLTTGHPSERVDDEVPGVAAARRAGRPRPSNQNGPSSGIRVLPVGCARAPVARRTPWRAVGGEAEPALYGRAGVQEVVADDAPRPAAGDRPATDDHAHGRALGEGRRGSKSACARFEETPPQTNHRVPRRRVPRAQFVGSPPGRNGGLLVHRRYIRRNKVL